MSDLPININKLLSGACDVAYAPTTVDVAANLSDILALIGTPDVNPDYALFGSTVGGSGYTREIESEGLSVDQRQGDVFEDITNISRTWTTQIAEISPEHLQIVEEAPEIETIAAGANTSAQKLVAAGSFDEFTRYRIAFIAQRRKSQGLVIPPTGDPRGCYVVAYLPQASLAADSSEITFEEGGLATASVTFKAFPEATLPSGRDTILWFEEQPGTISAT